MVIGDHSDGDDQRRTTKLEHTSHEGALPDPESPSSKIRGQQLQPRIQGFCCVMLSEGPGSETYGQGIAITPVHQECWESGRFARAGTPTTDVG